MTTNFPRYLRFAAALAGVFGTLGAGCVAPGPSCTTAGAYLGDSAACPSTAPVHGSECTARQTCGYCIGAGEACTNYCVCGVAMVDAGNDDALIADATGMDAESPDAGPADAASADATSPDTGPGLVWNCRPSCPIGGPAFPPDLPMV